MCFNNINMNRVGKKLSSDPTVTTLLLYSLYKVSVFVAHYNIEDVDTSRSCSMQYGTKVRHTFNNQTVN